MKLFLTFVFTLLSIKNYSQSENVKYVYFNHFNPSIVYSDIEISILENSNEVKIYVKKDNQETTFNTTTEKLSNLSEALLKINAKDVMQNVRNCLDSGYTELKFSSTAMLPQNVITYSVDCLSIEDSKNVRKDLFKAIILILEIAKLNFNDLE